MTNIITNSIKKALSVMMKHKITFIAIILLQLLFFSSLITIQTVYQSRIMESALEIINYLEEIEPDPDNAFGENPLLVYNAYKNIMRNIIKGSLLTFVMFIILGSGIWFMTAMIYFSPKLKELPKFILKFLVIALAYAIPLIFIIYGSLFANFLDILEDFTKAGDVFLLLFIVVTVFLYFAIISLCLCYKNKLKDVFKKTLIIGVKKAHIILATYLIIIVLVSIALYLFYITIEMFLPLFLLAAILFITTLVFARMFIFAVVDGIRVD